MKLIHSLMVGLAVFAASITAAEAHDSFSLGINIGGYGYNAYPAVTYRAVPEVIYYDSPRVYYPAAYSYYNPPVVVRRDVYYGGPRYRFEGRGFGEGYGHHWHHGRHH